MCRRVADTKTGIVSLIKQEDRLERSLFFRCFFSLICSAEIGVLFHLLERVKKTHLPESNIAFEKYMEDKISFWDRLFFIGYH